MSADTVFLVSFIPSGYCNLSTCSWTKLPKPWGRDLMKPSHLGLGVPNSLTLVHSMPRARESFSI